MSTLHSTRQSVALDAPYEISATPATGTARHADHAAQRRYALASAAGSWGREFRLLLTLADRHGISLDEEALVFYDVRDLQALQQRIAAATVRGAPRRRTVAGR